MGRFTQEDTYIGNLAMPQTLNLYVYTMNNPLRFVDPTGHAPVDEFMTKIYDSIVFVDARSMKKANERAKGMYEYADQAKGNKAIAQAQAALFMAGYDLGPNGIDGQAGSYTREAIKEFQRAAGIKPTGEIDGVTSVALLAVTHAGMDKHQIRELGKIMGNYEIKYDIDTKESPGFFQLPNTGTGYGSYNRDPKGDDNWGTAAFVDTLIQIADQWYQEDSKNFIRFGDISRKEGRKLKPHNGHKNGIEADLVLYYSGVNISDMAVPASSEDMRPYFWTPFTLRSNKKAISSTRQLIW